MAFTDTLIAALVLIGVFFLAYSAIRHQGLLDTVKEIRDIVKGKYEDVKDGASELKYQN